ncbi:hypothetical protein MAPG_02758 [Magnaporthiopsis poae ATCC 64411]|uniref:Uncharacterized protein n=1 Tax=Magnaporthiopsis poae (strain ATCC 64411 / 73-15) TaxID=644358 RepID=A0A0C4DS81_MAGP6|nr:hypothetical protein MAPG_02758 [Magnaporthiopsis poae ATCC 64411]
MDSIRVILRRNGPVDDVERQQAPAPTASTVSSSAPSSAPDSPRPRQEMEERDAPNSRFLHRLSNSFSRPAIPSFLSRRSSVATQQNVQGSYGAHAQYDPRPTSSHYSTEALSPKSANFSINMPHLPSTRLHLPNLARTWTQGSNGPPSRPGTSQGEAAPASLHVRRPGSAASMIGGPMFPELAQPQPAVHAARGGNSGSGLSVPDPAEQHLADLADTGRDRRRRRRRHHRNGDSSRGSGGSSTAAAAAGGRVRLKKNTNRGGRPATDVGNVGGSGSRSRGNGPRRSISYSASPGSSRSAFAPRSSSASSRACFSSCC